MLTSTTKYVDVEVPLLSLLEILSIKYIIVKPGFFKIRYSFISPTVGTFTVLQQQVDSQNRKSIDKKNKGQ